MSHTTSVLSREDQNALLVRFGNVRSATWGALYDLDPDSSVTAGQLVTDSLKIDRLSRVFPATDDTRKRLDDLMLKFIELATSLKDDQGVPVIYSATIERAGQYDANDEGSTASTFTTPSSVTGRGAESTLPGSENSSRGSGRSRLSGSSISDASTGGSSGL
jgi:hypothetical protein